MIFSESFVSGLIAFALSSISLVVVILIVLWIRDLKNDRLW